MPEKREVYTPDETVRLTLSAWKVGFFFYNAIGATIEAARWRTAHEWSFDHMTFVEREGWFGEPAESIVVTAQFEAFHPETSALAGTLSRREARNNASSADVRLWALGLSIGLPLPNEPAGGFGPASPSTTPGPSPASLPVEAVRATGEAVVNGQRLVCDEVFKR